MPAGQTVVQRDPGRRRAAACASALAWSSHTSGTEHRQGRCARGGSRPAGHRARRRGRRLVHVRQPLRGRRHHGRRPPARFASRSGTTDSMRRRSHTAWRGRCVARSSMPTSHPSARTSCGRRERESPRAVPPARYCPDGRGHARSRWPSFLRRAGGVAGLVGRSASPMTSRRCTRQTSTRSLPRASRGGCAATPLLPAQRGDT